MGKTKKRTGKAQAIAPPPAAVHPIWAGDPVSLSGSVHAAGFLGLSSTLADQVVAHQRVADGELPEDVYLPYAPDSCSFAKSLSFTIEVSPDSCDYVQEDRWIDIGVSLLPLLSIHLIHVLVCPCSPPGCVLPLPCIMCELLPCPSVLFCGMCSVVHALIPPLCSFPLSGRST